MPRTGPFLRASETTSQIMWIVFAACMPALGVAAYLFGVSVFITVLISVASALVFEFVWCIIRRMPITISDGSAAVTGLLFAFTVPSQLPWHVAILGVFVAIIFGKHAFGGLGANTFNPALLGRALVFALYPMHFADYALPESAIDALSSASPLASWYQGELDDILAGSIGERLGLYWQLFIGNSSGSIGEVSGLALAIGAAVLAWRGIITLHAPVACIVSVGLFGWLWGFEGFATGDPFVHILSGGVLLGAIFMATDYVTAPMLSRAKIVYGCIIGALTITLRMISPYPEGVMYAILIANPLVPVLDRFDYRMNAGIPLFKKLGNSKLSSILIFRNIGIVVITLLVLSHIFVPMITKEIARQKAIAERAERSKALALDLFGESANVVKEGTWDSYDEELSYFAITKDGKEIGYAIESYGDGYGDLICVLVGVASDQTLHGVSIISHQETKNLGSKIEDASFTDQFVGKDIDQLTVATRNSEGDIQGITAATISSKAVAEDAVWEALNFASEELF